jgi:hypothetical protein
MWKWVSDHQLYIITLQGVRVVRYLGKPMWKWWVSDHQLYIIPLQGVIASFNPVSILNTVGLLVSLEVLVCQMCRNQDAIKND